MNTRMVITPFLRHDKVFVEEVEWSRIGRRNWLTIGKTVRPLAGKPEQIETVVMNHVEFRYEHQPWMIVWNNGES